MSAHRAPAKMRTGVAMDDEADKTLPLDSWHRALGARMVPFAGYQMPVQYEGIW